MRILIIGLGLMGPTIAKDCAEAENVTKVTGCDIDQARLDEVYNYVDNTKFDV